MHPRKLLVRHFYPLLFLIVAAGGASALGAPEPADPIVGTWIWDEHKIAIFKADGTVSHPHGTDGTWVYLKNPEVQRHYRIVWSHGIYIDELVCSEDGQRAHVRNKEGKPFEARRTIDDPPAATPPSVVPTLASPAPAPARPTLTTTGTNAADPIVGEWTWLKGQAATFLPDGTVQSATSKKGTWEFLHNPEPERKYRVTLGPGKYASDVLYDPATGAGRATNSVGRFFRVAPAPATNTPDKPSDYFGTPGHLSS